MNDVLSGSIARRLEDGFAPLLVAMCTYAMRGFAACFLWLKSASEGSIVGQYIPLLLGTPCFKASNFFFKVAYTLNQRGLRRLGRKSVALGGEDYSVDFDGLCLNIRTAFELQKAERDVTCRLEAAKRRINKININHGDLLSERMIAKGRDAGTSRLS